MKKIITLYYDDFKDDFKLYGWSSLCNKLGLPESAEQIVMEVSVKSYEVSWKSEQIERIKENIDRGGMK